MNLDPRTEAAFEAACEKCEQEEMLDDLMTAVRYFLKNGEKRAAILLIEKAFSIEGE